MKFYRTHIQTGADSYQTKWAGSLAGATADRMALKTPGAKPVTEEIDIPTDKVGLLAWLNKEAS